MRSDLAEVVEDRAAFWGALADDDGRAGTARIEPAGPHPVRAARRRTLAAAVDVLLGNVFAHTPEGTPYAVSVRAAAGPRPCSSVEDGGPGIIDADAPCSTAARAPADRPGSGSTSRPPPPAPPAASCGSSAVARLGGARLVLDLPVVEDAGGDPGRASWCEPRSTGAGRSRSPRSSTLALYDPERRLLRDGGSSRSAWRLPHQPRGRPALRCGGRAGARRVVGARRASPTVFTVVEAGAGPGTLARSVLAAAPACAGALRYVLVERVGRPAGASTPSTWPWTRRRSPSPSRRPRRRGRAPRPSPVGPIVVSLADLPRVPGPVRRARQRAPRQPALRAARAHGRRLGGGPRRPRRRRASSRSSSRRPRRPASTPRSGARVPRPARRPPPGCATRSRSPGPAAGWSRSTTPRPPPSSPQRPWAEWVRTYRRPRSAAAARSSGLGDAGHHLRGRRRPAAGARRSARARPTGSARHGIDDLVEEGRRDLARAGRHRRPRRGPGPQPRHARPRRSSTRRASAPSASSSGDGRS